MSRDGRSIVKWGVLVTAALLVCLVVGVAPVGAAGTIRVDGDAAGCVNSSGQGDPYGVVYCKIQDAVIDATLGDTIHVYPRAGVYDEGVDLSAMEPDGDITLITVNAAGVPTPGTVTVDNHLDAPEFYTGDPPFDGDVTIDGFVLASYYGAIDVSVGPKEAAVEGGTELGPATSWDVEIRNVDASHTGGDGIVVSAQGNVTIENCTTNDNEGVGILVGFASGDVTITGCTANDNHWPTTTTRIQGAPTCYTGGICVVDVSGQAKIKESTANNNDQDGILVQPAPSGEAGVASALTPDQVIIDRCTANQNELQGISVRVLGDVTITNSTTNDNGEDGFYVGGLLDGDELGAILAVDGGDVTIENCTAKGNTTGFYTWGIGGSLSIQACIAMDNYNGLNLGYPWAAEGTLVNGSIICGNECGVYLGGGDNFHLGNAIPIPNLEGNWWGCPAGPEAAGCDPICQYDSIGVDFTPWISKITASATVDPVNVGQPTVVSFQFSANPAAVYLGQGPGDLHGAPTFIVTTDNGTVVSSGFIGASEGRLEVTLTPAHTGTATVWVDGPCGLDQSIVLGVVAAAEFVPEPGTVLLLGSGLMGLAGYATLRLRKR